MPKWSLLLFVFVVWGCSAIELWNPPYVPFKTGEIKAEGWLLNQLEIQAQGLSGHLQHFWPNVANSTWVGGQTQDPDNDSENVPYWLNGVVPLTFLLDDDKDLRRSVLQYVDYILSHQAEDGWFGSDCCDPWPRFPLLFALTQYAEAYPQDTRTIPALWAFIKNLNTLLQKNPLTSWASYRWQDLVKIIWWLYDNHPQGQQEFLIEMAIMVQQQGFDWASFYTSSDFPLSFNYTNIGYETHGVNNGQAIKSSAVWYRFSQDPADKESTYLRIHMLDTYHGQASGIFSCSEHLAGLDPSQGSELCTVVETMFSFEEVFATFGDVQHADRIESLAFNALPAALDPHMWAHNYLQQSNEIRSFNADPNIYRSDGPPANIYGLQPWYACCTVNFGQGWPKFTNHMYMRTADDGIAVVTYAPSSINTQIHGNPVNIFLKTDYPFDEVLTFSVNSTSDFPLYFRIPSWCNAATVQTDDQSPVIAAPGQMFPVIHMGGSHTYTLTLPMTFRIENRLNDAISIKRGPLLYSLKIEEQWTQTRYYAFNSSDWEVDPGSDWNVALVVDRVHPEKTIQFKQGTMNNLPFSPNGSPVQAFVYGRTLDSWDITKNAASVPPQSPVTSSEPQLQYTLLPFGATNLRIAEFPVLQ
eukprot:TRINITY_DN8182_c0_g2_i3.p1 TRINITY_DN8182_c0_g2~~TRINITY_DN8182_c0_g2_i3.p1  ORF type:complete len:660 (+),score=134.27 TRINITY_DN8182_c0_g2_i3:63-1982(+)